MQQVLTRLLLISILPLPGFAQTLTWSNEIPVANGSMYGSVRPRITVASGNIPVVMWGGGTSTEPLYTARGNGSTFNSPVTITPNGVDPAIMTWSGPDIAASGNTVYVVLKREPEMSNNIYLLKSTDGGATWSDTTRVDGMNGPYDRFPSVAVTSSGNPAVMFMTFDMMWNNAGYAVTNSTDGGMTFPMPVNVNNLGSSNVCDCCPGYIEINGSNQAAAWRRNNNNMRDMWAGVSTSSGLSFTTGLDVDNTNWMLSSCPSSGPDPYLWNDSLFTVFMSGQSGSNRVYINTHNITTQANGYTAMLNPGVPAAAIQNYPFIAGSGDTIVVVWQESQGGNTDVYYAWSTTGSEGLFSNVMLLSSSTTGNQTNPHVAYANGTFHFVWTDENSGNVIYRKATINPTGISEKADATMLRAYPNPSNGTMTLDLSAFGGRSVNVKIIDMTGRTVEAFATAGENRAMLRQQDAGIYFAEISNETASCTTRIIFY